MPPRPFSAAGASVGGQFRAPFMPPDPVDDSEAESLARRTGNQKDEPSETGGEPWRYTADVAADEPSFGGAIEGRGGPLADQISSTEPKAIESGKVIRGAIEAADV